MANIFQHLLLLGRPASGKSEFIDYMKKVPLPQRAQKFHIGDFEEIDDFPWIWEKFMEDDIWERAGYPRLFSKHYMPGNPGMMPEGGKLLWFCMEKFNEAIPKMSKQDKTLFIEFACGGERSFKGALEKLKPQILKPSAILFIYTTRDEAWRRNVARYQEKLKDSILSHMVPKETYDHFYADHDWLEITHNEPSGYFNLQGQKIPFVTMNNEPESTDPKVLEPRYGEALAKLWELYAKRV